MSIKDAGVDDWQLEGVFHMSLADDFGTFKLMKSRLKTARINAAKTNRAGFPITMRVPGVLIRPSHLEGFFLGLKSYSGTKSCDL
jgi:hypothetical protein